MKIFISWSGPISLKIASIIYDWLPMVVQRVVPFLSTEIDKGTRWNSDIARELQACSFGIACVTSENREAPWLLFEAGALSKSVEEGRLAPILFGLEQSDIQKSPLSQFQMTKFDKAEMLRLLRAINDLMAADKLDDKVIEGTFNALWPALDKSIADVLAGSPLKKKSEPDSSERLMGAVEELLSSTRSISQVVLNPERLLPREYLDYVVRKSVRGRHMPREEADEIYLQIQGAQDLVAKAAEMSDLDQMRDAIAEALKALRSARIAFRNTAMNGHAPPSVRRSRLLEISALAGGVTPTKSKKEEDT